MLLPHSRVYSVQVEDRCAWLDMLSRVCRSKVPTGHGDEGGRYAARNLAFQEPCPASPGLRQGFETAPEQAASELPAPFLQQGQLLKAAQHTKECLPESTVSGTHEHEAFSPILWF